MAKMIVRMSQTDVREVIIDVSTNIPYMEIQKLAVQQWDEANVKPTSPPVVIAILPAGD